VKTRADAKHLPFADAVRAWHAVLEGAGFRDRMAPETVPIADAVGRVPAHIIRTKYACPTYRAAAMDGYAVRSEDVEGATTDAPVRLRVRDDAEPIDTGGAVPAKYDAVVPIEHVAISGDSTIDVERAASAGKNVRLPGDDAPPGVAIGWPGIALRPLDCATLLASGVSSVEVIMRPRLAVIPTGDEVVQPDRKPAQGTVIESNSLMVAGEARAIGADVTIWPVVRDDDDALIAALREAIASADVVALLAGSSAGRRDRGAAAMTSVGVIDVRGVATRPARPVILGHAGAVALIDLPGYPVSCHFAFEAYAAPLLRRLAGLSDPPARRARLTTSVHADESLDEWRAATLLTAPGSPRAMVAPFDGVGGGLYQLDQADARFHLKRGTGRFGRYAAVPWTQLRGADDASRALFVGPYDPLIEEMAALGGFRCRWTCDETGEALDDGIADAVGVIVRDGDLSTLRARAGQGRMLLPIGARREGLARSRKDSKRSASPRPEPGTPLGDPWEGAAAVVAGVMSSARCTRYVAERFDVNFEEGEPALYAIVWEDRPGRRFPWGIVLAAALSALADAAAGLGWKNIGSASEVTG